MMDRIIALAVAATLVAGGASAQERTERFIPIGQSPGISGVFSMVGTIQAVDSAGRTVTVQGGAETWTVRVLEATDIWIDRSSVQSTNLVGGWSDLEVGRTVEVKCVDYATKEEADWLKVAPPGVTPPSG